MGDLDRKIYYAFEKFFSAYRSMQWELNKRYSLSPIMIQFLKYLSEHEEDLRTITNLSLEYSLTKPTVSDAINVLIKKGFLRKRDSGSDRRIKHLELTSKGKNIIKKIEEFEGWFYEAIGQFPIEHKSMVYTFLIEILRLLKSKGNIALLKSCIICSNFEPNKYSGEKDPHLCKLLNIRLSNEDIRIDCPSSSPIDQRSGSIRPILLKERNKGATQDV